MKARENVWAQSLLVRVAVRNGEPIARKDTWIRHRMRISRLPREIGEQLDNAGAGVARMRYVAYGHSRVQQRKRLKEVLAELAAKEPAVPLELERGPALVRARGVKLPDTLKDVPEE